MNLGIGYALMGLAAVVVGMIARFSAYTVLVKFSRWLPEKATKSANLIAMVVSIVGLVAVVAHMVLTAK
ncbi:MAG: hypothetical protein K2X93_23815 [Candidatus Obscuribacterales bacterium]|nr:hypothetical protein [Candidatus Obscuribacterales bacterium]